MKILSQQYIDLVRAQRQGTTLSEAELQAEIPSIIQPTIQVPSGLIRGIPATTVPQRTSFCRTDSFTTVGAVGPSSNQLAILGSGLWRIHASMVAVAEGAAIVGDDHFVGFYLADPATTAVLTWCDVYLALEGGTTFGGEAKQTIEFLIPEDQWFLYSRHSGVPVGSTLIRVSGLVCNKLA